MHILAFVDLDDSLFQTLPKCPAGEPVRPVAYAKDGSALSYMTDRQHRLFESLDRIATLIPTTARNRDAYSRVNLPFRSFAVLNFGGLILEPGGSLHAGWDDRVRPRSLALADRFQEIRTVMEDFNLACSLGIRIRVITDADMPLYLVCKHPSYDLDALVRLRDECLAGLDLSGFFVHHNHNNLSLVPEFLGKEKAVAYLLKTHFSDTATLTLGLGDSQTDADFLQMCDFAMLPGRSQLSRCLPAVEMSREER